MACALLSTGESFAQPQPLISKEEFAYQLERLDLDDSQSEAVHAIYERFLEAHRDASDALLAFHNWRDYTALQGEDSWNRDIDRTNEMYDAEKIRLVDAYFADLRTLLEHRIDDVDWLERAHLRWRHLKRGGDDAWGAAPDLIALVERVAGMDWRSNPQLAAALDRFDREMDAILRRAEDAYLKRRLRTASLVAAQDVDGLIDFYENFWKPESEMWLLAKRSIPIVRDLLDAEHAAEFESHATSLLYGDIYKPTRVDVLLTNALERDDLSEEAKGQLNQVQATLEQVRDRARREMIALANRNASLEMVRTRAQHFAAQRLNPEMETWPVEDEEYREALRLYREIGSELEERIARILAGSSLR